MSGGYFNRGARRDGGDRPFKIKLPGLRRWLRDEIAIFQQREKIRAEFGEAGIKRFDKEMEKRSKAQSSDRDET